MTWNWNAPTNTFKVLGSQHFFSLFFPVSYGLNTSQEPVFTESLQLKSELHFCWLLMSSLFHLQELTKYYQLLRKVALFLNRVLLVHLSWTGSKHLPCRKIQQCMRDLCHIHPTIIFLTLFFPSEILLQWLKPLLHTVLRIQITKLPSNTLKMDCPNSKWQSLYIISSIFFCKSFIWRHTYIYLF